MQELSEGLEAGTAVVVDARPMAAYNGWAFRQEPRGGHVSGAVPFPLAWFDALDDGDARQLLQARGVRPADDVIVYGHGRDDAEAAAARLAEIGFSRVRILGEGLPAWAATPDLPMDRLPRYRHLVHRDWLAKLLDNGTAPLLEGTKYVLAHVSFDNRDDYDQGHIPGAISLDTLFLEEPEHWNRRNPEELEQALAANGITWDTTVVLYGRHGRPTMEHEHPGRYAGHMAAMRAALLLLYAGVEDVRVLDGGLDSWLSGGGSLNREPVAPISVESFGRQIPARPDYVVELDEAREMLADPMAELVSVRSWREFMGETSGYHYVGPRGRIPGAVFGNCGSDAYHMQNYRNHDHTMRDYHCRRSASPSTAAPDGERARPSSTPI